MKLKGKTTIELTDVNTGEVTVIEDNNFVTNAFHNMCQPILRDHDTMHKMKSYYNNRIAIEQWMGGLLMFDTTLEDNPDNYFPPVTANMVGHGSEITYTGSDLSLGSFNNSMSDLSEENKRVFVWDFTAEQANGNIASVCLTTQVGGMIGYGTEIAGEENTNYQRLFSNFTKSKCINNFPSERRYTRPIYLSFENDYVLFIDYNTINNNNITFLKTYFSSKKEDIFKETDQFSNYLDDGHIYTIVGNKYTDYEVVNLDLTSVFGSGKYVGMAQDGKYLYIIKNNVSSHYWQANNTLTVVKIDLETLTYETFDVTNTTGEQVTVFGGDGVNLTVGFTFGVCDGYMFVPTTGQNYGGFGAKLYAINLEDNTIVKQVKTPDGKELIAMGTTGNRDQFSFGMTVKGKVFFMPNDREFFRTGDFIPIKCVSTNDFIARTMGTTGWMMGAQSTSYVGTYTYFSFPTDNRLYFGSCMPHNIHTTTGSMQFFVSVYPNVLMTINNLDTPVTKTPSQTMRITYTITKEE